LQQQRHSKKIASGGYFKEKYSPDFILVLLISFMRKRKLGAIRYVSA
jgi:hypothetical protein